MDRGGVSGPAVRGNHSTRQLAKWKRQRVRYSVEPALKGVDCTSGTSARGARDTWTTRSFGRTDLRTCASGTADLAAGHEHILKSPLSLYETGQREHAEVADILVVDLRAPYVKPLRKAAGQRRDPRAYHELCGYC
jgi:hypothetical protein